jgi:hypothetical protein
VVYVKPTGFQLDGRVSIPGRCKNFQTQNWVLHNLLSDGLSEPLSPEVK